MTKHFQDWEDDSPNWDEQTVGAAVHNNMPWIQTEKGYNRMVRTLKRRSKPKEAPRKLKRRGDSRKKLASNVEKSIKARKAKESEAPVEFLHSGSHTLNLALSGKAQGGGWARGRVCNVVGDGSSGKTVCALELAFWCYQAIKHVRSKIFANVKKVTIVYNNCEGVMDFPLVRMYGQGFVDAVEWICIKDIEAMGRDYIRRMDNLAKGEFLLYIVDSWDSLGSSAETKRFEESVAKDKDMEGSYALEKQKFAGRFFAHISGKMENNSKDATLFIISQVRTKIGITFGKKTYRAGGKALDFYTHQVAWIAEMEKLTKTKRKHKRVYGIKSKVKVERSKVGKPFRESNFTILFDYGIDDINSMADFLYGKGSIRFNGNSFSQRPTFVKYIESDKGHEDKLISATEEEWFEIEQAFEDEVTDRKKRY